LKVLKPVFSVRYRYLYILLLAGYSFFNILFTVGNQFFDFKIETPYLFAVLFVVVVGVWESNRWANDKIEKYKVSLRTRLHPLILLFAVSLVNVALTATLSLYLLYLVLGMPLIFNTTHITLLLAFGFRINLFLNCINAIVYFMDRLKRAQLEAATLKQQSTEARFEALRNQINPHFLFNSFNVLSSLIYKDVDKSAKFIDQLSLVYRYLLNSQNKKLVLLEEEIAFIDAYLYLLHIRFAESLEVTLKIEESKKKLFIAPSSLQLLVENAIKHNVVSKKEILRLSITTLEKQLIVSNNLQEKIDKESSTEVGLKNIKSRYAFLTDRPVEIIKTQDSFTVKLPLLEVENI
jgi:two-component system, LytTR family, sensor kinase